MYIVNESESLKVNESESLGVGDSLGVNFLLRYVTPHGGAGGASYVLSQPRNPLQGLFVEYFDDASVHCDHLLIDKG